MIIGFICLVLICLILWLGGVIDRNTSFPSDGIIMFVTSLMLSSVIITIMLPKWYFGNQASELYETRSIYIEEYLNIISDKELSSEESNEMLNNLIDKIDEYNKNVAEMNETTIWWCLGNYAYEDELLIDYKIDSNGIISIELT